MSTINVVKSVRRVLAGEPYDATDGMGYWQATALEDGFMVRLADSVVFLTDDALEFARMKRAARPDRLKKRRAAKRAATEDEIDHLAIRVKHSVPPVDMKGLRKICACDPKPVRHVCRTDAPNSPAGALVCTGCGGLAVGE